MKNVSAKTRNCGILDYDENKLCLRDDIECPINIISEEKINNINSYFNVGNKTFYYGYDENAKYNKLNAGFYVDTDIYINKKEENFILLDTYTISGVLEENKMLYRGVDLGFDPYSIEDIDKKGKSYLKIRYNAKHADLISFREQYKKYLSKKNMENELIKPTTNHFSTFTKIGIAGYSYLIYIINFLILIGCCRSCCRTKKLCLPQANQNNFLYCFVPLMIPFLVLTLIPAIKSCTIVGKLNEIDDKMNISVSYLKTINITYIILYFVLLGLILGFIAIFYIYTKRKGLSDNQEIESARDTTINNINNINYNTNFNQPKIK